MNQFVKTLAEEPRKTLVALGMFKFLTTQQLVRLGVSEAPSAETVLRKMLVTMRRKNRPFIQSKKLGTWLPHVHALTEHGAAELADMYRVPVEDIRYPKGKVQFSERLAHHRFAQIDFHIGLRRWVLSRDDVYLAHQAMDFDVTGSRRTRDLQVPTQIDLPKSDRPIIADGVFIIEVNDTPLIYALEVHRRTQTRAVGMQIQRYMEVLESGALSFKHDLKAPTYICSVHMLDNVLKGAKAYLMSNPNFAPYRKFFLFNTAENLAQDFSAGWHFADDQPANPFPKPENPELSRLLDDFDI